MGVQRRIYQRCTTASRKVKSCLSNGFHAPKVPIQWADEMRGLGGLLAQGTNQLPRQCVTKILINLYFV
ncbi:MAG TPA: hypothetical protein DD979_04595 [Gammaproteobacteria bacterium]|nr:hypothetical protein [Gammaproteobacteria bacterium]